MKKDAMVTHLKEAMFTNAPVAIVAFRGTNFIIEFANDFYLQILGKTKDILGKPLFEVSPELIGQGIDEILKNVLQTGTSFSVNEHELIVERNNKKETLYFNCVYQALRENNKVIVGVSAVFSEVTNQVNTRKFFENNEKIYSTIFMKLPFAFAILKGKNHKVVIANESIKEIWGKGNDIIGKDLFEILPEVISQGFPKIIDEVFTSGNSYYGYEMEVYITRDSNLKQCFFNFVYQAHREENDAISGIILMAYEVTEQVLIKKAIAASEEKFRCMTDLMPVKVSYGDVNGTTNYYNQRWIEYTGLTMDELVLFGWDKIIHPDDKKKSEKKWKNAIKNGQDFEMELRILDKNKHYNWHLCRVKPVREATGEITHWIGINTEIQNQKLQNENLEETIKDGSEKLDSVTNILAIKVLELEESQKKLQSEYSRKLIEASKDPLVTINTKGKIMDMNEAMIQFSEKSREQIMYTNFADYFTETDKAKMVYQEVFDKGFVTNFPLVMKDGKLTDVLFNGAVYKDENNEILGAVVVARDITAQKTLEKELIAAKTFAELATKNAEKSRNSAQDATKSKQQFLSNMSHEIRTPMNAIIGFTKVVLKTNLTAKQKEYIMAIKISGDALIVLINDILDLAKVDSGKMIFEKSPFNLVSSISLILHLFETKIKEKNLKLITNFDPDIPNVLLGDTVRLNQIILNLLSNAVKFTHHGKITVSVALIAQNKEDVTIKFSVEDTGIGIKALKIATIFENFQQATNTTSRLYGGTGLGLAIVKQLVELQGGKVDIVSTENEGSCFSFNLKLEKTQSKIALPKVLKFDAKNKNLKILVVEDMELNQLLMKTLLIDFGFECDIAENGKIAIEKIQKKNYDIVLMDLQMPEMDGFEATIYIRQVLQLTLPIIALTADVTSVDVDKCRKIGMDDYISKPVDERLLYDKLVSFTKKDTSKQTIVTTKKPPIKVTDLSYIKKLTQSNKSLMIEIIGVYLKQTPLIIKSIQKSLLSKDWKSLKSEIHKLLPSLTIVGIHQSTIAKAKKLDAYVFSEEISTEMHKLLLELLATCHQSCKELAIERTILTK